MTFIYKNRSLLTKIFLALFVGCLLFSFVSAENIIMPRCDPAQTDSSKPDFCGEKMMIKLITNITKWINIIIIPLAVIMIAAGGFMIMTAAGSTERVKKGKDMMTIAIIGVLISLGSFFIIKYIVQILGADINIQEVSI